MWGARCCRCCCAGGFSGGTLVLGTPGAGCACAGAAACGAAGGGAVRGVCATVGATARAGGSTGHAVAAGAIQAAADRAAAYGLDSIIIDGNDADVVYRTANAAFDKARGGGGPSLIEAKTYRHSGHSRADPGTYRPEAEVKAWLERDPILAYRARLLAFGIDEVTVNGIDKEVLAQVDAATEAAKASPAPVVDGLEDNLWADGGAAWRN